ncbi:hypothetical protein BAUCODRAFT_448965 [Baudoinia panamericana UAMH 10762]|uniref:Uncharacterized protein n=1 Tax=Baudoinia panamericana (strain UAMH 10762) TaxID=717646 RepID=M2N095_BAUPA|nr:uncharacterized protein BAUCODRAFT_448965 [Baudoinia panamericana UAMH 10762]EMC97353.1 hypothetical protein BAUCODRAFT_448965 [Baudoinia panamericana UAMH 10762]
MLDCWQPSFHIADFWRTFKRHNEMCCQHRARALLNSIRHFSIIASSCVGRAQDTVVRLPSISIRDQMSDLEATSSAISFSYKTHMDPTPFQCRHGRYNSLSASLAAAGHHEG